MQIILNGQPKEVKAGITLLELLQEMQINPATIAVEQNLEIVPRGKYQNTVLNEGDKLEIISFVGGG